MTKKGIVIYMISETLKYIKGMMKANSEQTGGLAIPTLKEDYLAIREAADKPNDMLPLEKGVTFVQDELGGVEGEFSIPETMRGEEIILYLHGGGFAFGNARTSRAYASALAGESGRRVYSITYRMAPENPYPAAPNDCFAVYEALIGKYPDSKIVVLGESAGGNLTLVLMQMLLERKMKLPTCIGAFCPLTTVAEEVKSRSTNADTDIVIPGGVNAMLLESYVTTNDPHDPGISPLYGEFTGFPPMLIEVDSSEVLLDDAILVVEKARKAGVNVELKLLEETFHGISNLARMSPESENFLKETVVFIEKHC